jgi:SAM-dependent methyltransferase
VSDNDKTLQSYANHVQDYVAGTPQVVEGEFKAWINRALKLVPKHGTVLELGSAFGRDAAYIESKGFKVIATDAVQGFVDLLRQSGHEARLLNVLTDDFGRGYDMLFANAVLLHFKPDQVKEILQKAYQSLKPGGVLVFSVKRGNGSAWSRAKLNAPRYFYYWERDDLEAMIQAIGFEIIELSNAVRSDKWLQVIASKP